MHCNYANYSTERNRNKFNSQTYYADIMHCAHYLQYQSWKFLVRLSSKNAILNYISHNF